MKKTALLLLLASTGLADETGYDCDVGSVARGFGPIVGLLNDCASSSGYNFLPVPTLRPTQNQLDAFCSVSACEKAAQAYLSIRLPACDFVLSGQRLNAREFFYGLCQNYANLTAAPTTVPPPTTAPSNESSTSSTATPKAASSSAVTTTVVTAVGVTVSAILY